MIKYINFFGFAYSIVAYNKRFHIKINEICVNSGKDEASVKVIQVHVQRYFIFAF